MRFLAAEIEWQGGAGDEASDGATAAHRILEGAKAQDRAAECRVPIYAAPRGSATVGMFQLWVAALTEKEWKALIRHDHEMDLRIQLVGFRTGPNEAKGFWWYEAIARAGRVCDLPKFNYPAEKEICYEDRKDDPGGHAAGED